MTSVGCTTTTEGQPEDDLETGTPSRWMRRDPCCAATFRIRMGNPSRRIRNGAIAGQRLHARPIGRGHRPQPEPRRRQDRLRLIVPGHRCPSSYARLPP